MIDKRTVARSTLSRVPMYISFVSGLPPNTVNISATQIANALNLGDVLVRKDLAQICGKGKPKVGYVTKELLDSLHSLLECKNGNAVIIGAGKIGKALLDYNGFEEFNISILAAFDINTKPDEKSSIGKPIYNLDYLDEFCKEKGVNIGIIAVPAASAQSACDALCKNNVKGILSFATAKLEAPDDVTIEYENIATSLAHLKMKSI
ncbi:MAG: redox-sensing transcriptional repressor Rex [Acutalibacteraceae bacterium]|nr:redox-sensing transcriptional repressor Rex [Acutalibacteraceae bacterium]